MNTFVRTLTRSLVATALTATAALGLSAPAWAAPTSHYVTDVCVDHQVHQVWMDEHAYLVPVPASC
jgi:hypothetical protein